jgi:hypothetical protein
LLDKVRKLITKNKKLNKNLKMDKNEISNKIILKQKAIDLENDFNKKNILRRDLQILHLRLDIFETKEKIDRINGKH